MNSIQSQPKTVRVTKVNKGEIYWILELEDGTQAGLPGVFERPSDPTEEHPLDAVLFFGPDTRFGDERERIVAMTLDPSPPLNILAFEQLLSERDRLRAGNIGLRRQLGFSDADGSGTFVDPPGSEPEAEAEPAPDGPSSVETALTSIGRRMRRAVRGFLED